MSLLCSFSFVNIILFRSILRQNGFCFAAKRLPFCGKMHSVLRQNAFWLAAICILFYIKLHFHWRQFAF